MAEHSIELDCPPGGIRPGDLLPKVIEGTKLKVNVPISTFFGNWTWVYDIDDDTWANEIVPIIKPRIENLYHEGLIRYGSW